METHKALPHNPILQDVKKGALRSYPMPLGVSYGALPQTYEYPLAAGSGGTGGDAFTGLAGDGDPLDALDLSSAVALTADGRDVAEDDGATGSGPRGWGVPLPSTGDVYPVRLIGALAMVDGGEADWKLLAVRTDDPLLGGVTGAWRVEAEMGHVCRERGDDGQRGSPLQLTKQKCILALSSVSPTSADVAQLVGPDRVLTLQELLQQRPGVPATYTADARAKGRAGAAAALTDAARAAGRARVDQATRFFLSYKKADPWDVAEPSPVTLAFGGRLLDAPAAMAVARQGHLHWCALMGAVLHHARVQGIVEPAKLARLKGRLVACAAVGADPSSLGTGPPPPVPDGVWV